jgi:hypothetical protein
MCGASQKDVTGKPSRTGKIQRTLYSDVPLGREMRARQQQQSGRNAQNIRVTHSAKGRDGARPPEHLDS